MAQKIILPAAMDVFTFVAQTHLVEGINLNILQVQATFEKKMKEPYSTGHLWALSEAIKVLNSNDFPCREPRMLTHPIKSDAALFWLKDLHKKMLTPLANTDRNFLLQDPRERMPIHHGKYRITYTENIGGSAPAPTDIPLYMHHWLLRAAAVHNQVKDKIDFTYGLSDGDYKAINDFLRDIPLWFATVQPFEVGNNRFGRLLANVFRLGWKFPFKAGVAQTEYDKFKKDLMEYKLEKPKGN